VTDDQTPSASRASFPADYGTRGGEADQLLAWADTEQRIGAAPNYWLTTVSAAGRPHARPIDGVWVDGTLCFGGSPATRWIRNLQENPAASVHLPSGDDVIILEGTAEFITDLEHPLALASSEASKTKYPQYYTGEDALAPQPFWSLRPKLVYAWSLTGFPNRATRWAFRDAAESD